MLCIVSENVGCLNKRDGIEICCLSLNKDVGRSFLPKYSINSWVQSQVWGFTLMALVLAHTESRLRKKGAGAGGQESLTQNATILLRVFTSLVLEFHSWPVALPVALSQ